MRKIITLFVMLTLMASSSAFAFYYDAQCMVPEGKLKKCSLDFSKKGMMIVTYKGMEYQGLNREIRGKSISNISMSQKKNFRKGATIGTIAALGPIGGLMLLWKKKMSVYGIEYGNGAKGSDSIVVAVKNKDGYSVNNYLQQISGKEIDYGMAMKK